jgi:hypothetical protein
MRTNEHTDMTRHTESRDSREKRELWVGTPIHELTLKSKMPPQDFAPRRMRFLCLLLDIHNFNNTQAIINDILSSIIFICYPTMLRLFTLFTIMAVATAFTAQSWGVSTKVTARTQTARFMFSADDDVAVKPLTEVSATMDTEATEDEAPKKRGSVVRNISTGGEAKEVQWVDPAMQANTNPLLMSWWAYVFFGLLPTTLLLNDAFHFLPKDGPIGFLGRM